MRDGQLRLIHRQGAEREDVHVDGPRTPALPPDPTQAVLDGAGGLQQATRWANGAHLHHRVQVVRLGWPDRSRLVYARRRQDLQALRRSKQADRALQVRQPIAQVRTQPEEGSAAAVTIAGPSVHEMVASAVTSSAPIELAAPGLWTTTVALPMPEY